ncbi:class I SAM-dependent methyltransferase [Sutcliffiella deserti]|uniref:class I SAM-dependent methyltransferase n=1 Tax=Sutcliffiella deserti TaxID=2875501 RepID=UPI001CC15594|nr:class I SAM-dependent methyltransferase [Sutcliffiella deserti]
MIVTTAGRSDNAMINFATQVANDLNVAYFPRNKKSIPMLQLEYNEDILVIGKVRFEWYQIGQENPIFFHPNSAAFRAKRWYAGEIEPFLQATGLKTGMRFLDCTLGLGSDSIIASLATGDNGRVTGIEENRFLAYLVQTGLKMWKMENEKTQNAMQRIEVIQGNHLDILIKLPNNSYDVVYFDPMFEKKIEESSGIKSIRRVVHYEDIQEYAITEAKRVANKRVVLKDQWQSERFQQHGFKTIKRKTAKFHYGFWEKI